MSEHRSEIKKLRTGKKDGSGCVFACLIGLVLLPVLVYFSLVFVGSTLIVADPITPVNAVVILSGDDGNRLAMAADMRERGYVYNLVITNTNRAANRRLASEAREAGFPASSIYITDLEVDSTVDEARAVLQFSKEQGWSALMVVTDPYHSFRARIIFRRELRGQGITLSFRPVVGHWFQSRTWFYHREGWRIVFLELTKLAGYLFLQVK
jgi:uncharacterized SAM-binding protein YcdF (DUF218 family)